MADPPHTPPGMALACQTCGWRPDGDLTVGLVKAHFETEHNTTDVRLDLVVLCPRCDTPMTFEHTHGQRDHFTCQRCHRTRSVRRETTGDTP